MRAQSQIQRTLGSDDALERVATILSQEQFDSRRALGRRICAEFDFRDRRGQPQMAGCLKALQALAQTADRITLPPAGAPVPGGGQPALLAGGAVLAESVPERLGQVQELAIEPVADRRQRQVWNTLIATEHRQGMTTVVSLFISSHSAHIIPLVGVTDSQSNPLLQDSNRFEKIFDPLHSNDF